MRGIGLPVALAAVLSMATGCAGSPPSPAPISDLVRDFAEPYGSPGPYTIDFGDEAALRSMSGVTLYGRFSNIMYYGDFPLWEVAGMRLPALTGIDLAKVSTGAVFNRQGGEVGVLYGSFDPSSIGAKLTALGYNASDLGDGEKQWVPSGVPTVDNPLSRSDEGYLLGVIRVSRSRIVYGAAASDLDAVLANTRRLSDQPDVAAIAGCLGPAAAAELEFQPGLRPLGVGVTATSASGVRMEVCIATASDAAARTLSSALVRQLNSGRMLTLADQLSNPETEIVGGPSHLVRLSGRSSTADLSDDRFAGLVLLAMK